MPPSIMCAVFQPLGVETGHIVNLLIALVLASAIGVERELRQKSAGLRTHALVGVGAALFVLVSKYGFGDVLSTNRVVLDPSRMAAQIVSGIGFIGGGLIFVRRDAVRGLTTAAVVWLTAAVGAAAGAGLPVLALVATGAHFTVVYGYPLLTNRLRSPTGAGQLQLTYRGGQGVLRGAIEQLTRSGFSVRNLDVRTTEGDRVEVQMELGGPGHINQATVELAQLPGVVAVSPFDPRDATE